jgi:hypothetical protein
MVIIGGWVMKQLSIAIVISIFIGSGMAWSGFKTFTSAPAFATRIDFDQVFADATWQGEFNAARAVSVDRTRKSDRLNFRSVSPETALLPYCEPVASPFVDPILARIAGRCDA